jgi:hypothetical protein
MTDAKRPTPPTAFGGTLGVIALAFGIGVFGAYALDLHGHTCEACGNRWWHLGAFNLGDEGSHTCARCGQVQWWKNGVPHVFRAGHTPPKTLAVMSQEIRAFPRHELPSGTWSP